MTTAGNKVIVTGASGFIGRKLCRYLSEHGFQVLRASVSKKSDIMWEPDTGRKTESKFTKSHQICRIPLTYFASLHTPPKIFISASAVGYYTAGSVCDETGAKGYGFLSDVCEEWERTVKVPESVRVCKIRLGQVLDSSGGLLQKALPSYSKGLGAVIGNGQQMMSWVSLDDTLRIIAHIIRTDSISGVVNVTAPQPVTNREFSKKLAEFCKRPLFLKIPAFLFMLLPGGMAGKFSFPMRSVWNIPTPPPSEKKFGKHPTQKPLSLLSRVIKSSTKPNDIIFDPFNGSEPSQKSYFELTRGKIDPTHWTNWAADEETGAISTFIGMPRRSNGALRIVRLDYEAYEEMAHAETKAIFENLRRQYNFLHIAVFTDWVQFRSKKSVFWLQYQLPAVKSLLKSAVLRSITSNKQFLSGKPKSRKPAGGFISPTIAGHRSDWFSLFRAISFRRKSKSGLKNKQRKY
ncbi:hypothetical protein CHS0354_002006 [Potamilus streckersoni]|uniref:TIGR01777 family protein n=1 Tax=Potamilus streckersoni TaxID=2493646 RepID=A0AAE0W6R3_9BIVA|nr:hypothetical protein CHS0354_002006 [Potamilus streckersoni]